MSVYVSQRDVVSVSGDESEQYLQGQISQDVLGLGIGESAWSLILQPQGKVDAWFRITRTSADSFLLDVDAGFGETLMARLQRFKLRTKADLELHTWDWHAIRGADAAIPEVPEDAIAASPAKGQAGIDLVGAELPLAAGEALTDDEFERLRIEAMVPLMGSELDDSTIPAEAGIVDESASFTKGCYTGQELVARVDSRGSNTPRRLRLVSGAGQVPTGTELMLDDKAAGVLTSTSTNSAGDGWVGLAYIKRSALEATTLTLDGSDVSVQS